MKVKYEKISTLPDESFAIFKINSQEIYCPYHIHPELELTLIQKGSGTRLIGDSLQNFDDGDCVLIGSELPHYYVGDAGKHKTPDGIVLQFHEECLGSEFFDLPETENLYKFIQSSKRGFIYDKKVFNQIEKICTQLLNTKGSRRVLLLIEILCILSEAKGKPLASIAFTPDHSDVNRQRIEKAFSHIMNHFDQEVTLTDVAAKCSLSPSAFSRTFHATTGKAFKQFLIELRVGHACKLLTQTDDSVLDIALACGFSNLSNFNRRFKEHTNSTPREYRKKAQL